MKHLIKRIFRTERLWSVIFIRFMVGWVFWSEGIQKFLYPETLGVGRFIKIGIPYPDIMAPFVGFVEITCGLMIIVGFLTRLASIPLIINMIAVIISTKIPIFLQSGFWAVSHEGRTDLCMILGSIYFLIIGGGSWSLDMFFSKKINSNY